MHCLCFVVSALPSHKLNITLFPPSFLRAPTCRNTCIDPFGGIVSPDRGAVLPALAAHYIALGPMCTWLQYQIPLVQLSSKCQGIRGMSVEWSPVWPRIPKVPGSNPCLEIGCVVVYFVLPTGMMGWYLSTSHEC